MMRDRGAAGDVWSHRFANAPFSWCAPRAARFMRRLAILLVASLAQPVAAQNVITVRPGAGGRIQVTPGAPVSIPIAIDMSSAGGANLASLATGLVWGSNRLVFDSVKGAGFGALTPNTSGAGGGTLGLSVNAAGGTTSTVTMADVFFTASTTPGSTSFYLNPSQWLRLAHRNAQRHTHQRLHSGERPVVHRPDLDRTENRNLRHREPAGQHEYAIQPDFGCIDFTMSCMDRRGCLASLPHLSRVSHASRGAIVNSWSAFRGL